MPNSRPARSAFSLRTLLVLVGMCAVILGGVVYVLGDPLRNLFGGRRGLAVVRNPDKVELFRLGDLPAHIDGWKAAPADFPVVAGPVAASSKTATELSDALLDRATYHWHAAKTCGDPLYAIKASFFQASDRVDVYFCFQCEDLAVVLNGMKTGAEDFGNSRQIFVRAGKAAFPNDAVLQSLEERR